MDLDQIFAGVRAAFGQLGLMNVFGMPTFLNGLQEALQAVMVLLAEFASKFKTEE